MNVHRYPQPGPLTSRKDTNMMLRIRKAMAQKEQGFTLIELLVVIIIIGILAAIAIPIFLNQRKKGVDASMKSDLKNAATAAEAYITDNPTTTATLTRTNLDSAGFKNTTGNTVIVAGSSSTTGTYIICAINPGSSTPAQYIVYNSNLGGLQAGFKATCS